LRKRLHQTEPEGETVRIISPWNGGKGGDGGINPREKGCHKLAATR